MVGQVGLFSYPTHDEEEGSKNSVPNITHVVHYVLPTSNNLI